MELKERAMAGTLESSDIYIIVEPNDKVEIELTSEVLAQFGQSIKDIMLDTLKELDVTGVKIIAQDKGAIDPVIKSRLQTAILRACKIKKYTWK